MPSSSFPSRSKVGSAYKHLKFLSPRARKLLSGLFAAGLFFFALLSLSIYVKDPDLVTGRKPTETGSQRKSLRKATGIAQHLVSRRRTSDAGAPQRPFRLLVASHNRLMWYDVRNNTTQVLHEGQGVHYGVFPGQFNGDGRLKTVWNVIRPHNWHPKNSQEFLVEFDAETGKEVGRVQIHSRFTHDAVRRGNRVYVANTEGGEVQELSFPDMKMIRALRLFTQKQHVNTLAPLEQDVVWAVLHNLGKSDAVKVELAADPRPRVTAELKFVGKKSHGLVAWGSSFVMLDSENGALVTVNPGNGEVKKIWQVPDSEEPSKFLKGLCVVDDVAYFGVNVWGPRSDRDSAKNDAEVAAVNLHTGGLLWRRRLPTHGLLNILGAPQLGEASTYRAMTSTGGAASEEGSTTAGSSSGSSGSESITEGGLSSGSGKNGAHGGSVKRVSEYLREVSGLSDGGAGTGTGATDALQAASGAGRSGVSSRKDNVEVLSGIDDPGVVAATRKLVDMGYKPKIGGKWASGLPRLDLKTKDSTHAWDAGISLPLTKVNIDKLRELVVNMPDDMWTPARQRRENAAVDGRNDNMNKFKPGVEALYMVFSDQSTEHVYRFPYYEYFKEAVEPIVEQIVGRADMDKVVRLQFARMKPGTEIKPHQDMGGYARFAHRIHIPIVTHSNVSFQVCPEMERSRAQTGRRMGMQSMDVSSCVSIPMAEGMVFELNNRIMHLVLNKSNVKRVQMVVDVSEKPRTPRRLKPGTVCAYEHAVMVCPPENFLP